EVHSILQRLRDLAVQGGNDSNNTESRDAIAKEASQLVSELTRVADATNFNGIQLLDGSNSELKFQVGADGVASSQISVDLSSANVKSIATELAGGDLSTTGTAYAIADITALTTAAAEFSTTVGGIATTVTTGTLD